MQNMVTKRDNDEDKYVPEEAVVESEGGVGDEEEQERGKEIEPGVVVIFFSRHLVFRIWI